jgi:hypothetical protein
MAQTAADAFTCKPCGLSQFGGNWRQQPQQLQKKDE